MSSSNDKLLDEEEQSNMLNVRNKIFNAPDSYFAKCIFKDKTDFNMKTLELYPELEQFRPKTKLKGMECVWCKKGGKHKTVYTSHDMFDKRGKLTCPKLLKEQCRNCGEMGHVMGKHCPEPRKQRCELLPPTKSIIFSRGHWNPREDSDYESGDSEDYNKFPLSDEEEQEQKIEEMFSKRKGLTYNPWNEKWEPDEKHVKIFPEVSQEVSQEVSPAPEEKKVALKKTWASIVATKKI